jgi:hypothetical protein
VVLHVGQREARNAANFGVRLHKESLGDLLSLSEAPVNVEFRSEGAVVVRMIMEEIA